MSRDSRDGSPIAAASPSIEDLRAALRAALNGDKPAFDQLFDKSFDGLYAVAWKLTGHRIPAERLTENMLVCAVDALRPAHDDLQPGAESQRETVVPPHLDL